MVVVCVFVISGHDDLKNQEDGRMRGVVWCDGEIGWLSCVRAGEKPGDVSQGYDRRNGEPFSDVRQWLHRECRPTGEDARHFGGRPGGWLQR